MQNDTKIYERVMGALSFAPEVNADDITVAVHDGVVTLAGSVSSYLQKQIARRVVKKLAGVKGVANEIQVKITSVWKPNDSEIAKAIENAFTWHSSVPGNSVKFTVEDGNVVLSGKVPWQYQRADAERSIRYLTGIKNINNQILVGAPLSIATPDIVKDKLKTQFENMALIDAESISIQVKDSELTLTGKVRSWAERSEASKIAWSIPGVTFVNNNLLVTA